MTEPFQEHEYKLESNANLQLKYSTIDQPEDFRKKFIRLIDLLNIKSVKESLKRITDKYYDDRNKTIHAKGFSLRIRTGESDGHASQVTLKSYDESTHSNKLKRVEFNSTIDSDSYKRLLTETDEIGRIFPDQRLTLESNLEPLVHVINDRLAIEIATDLTIWKMSYDRFYFFYPSRGIYSPYFSEIELESTQPSIDEDPQIEKLQLALTDIFGLLGHRQTKFRRAMDYVTADSPPTTLVCSVGFDIVGYSTMNQRRQLESIQLLNKFIKDSIEHITKSTTKHIYIPTGDGMFVVFESHYSNIIPIIEQTQRTNQRWNTEHPSSSFVFRTAIHAGLVFKYTDVNENLNYAGNGINIAARVLSYGEGWHIVSSEEGRNLLISHNVDAAIFQDAGTKTVKHGVKIHIYNIVSHGRFGNPVLP